MSERIGYARVSTKNQLSSLESQVSRLNDLGCIKVFTDVASGAKEDRPGLQAALEYMRPSDILTVTHLDRLGRSASHTLKLMEDFNSRGVQLHAVDSGIDTSTPAGAAQMKLVSVLAEIERDLIRSRTREGLEAARAKGRIGGRPRKLTPEAKQAGRAALEAGLTVKEVAALHGVSRWTIQRLKTDEI